MIRMQQRRLRKRLARGAGRWVAIVALAFSSLSTLAPQAALAQNEEDEIVDARLEGYAANTSLPPSGVAFSYIVFIFLAVLAAGPLFKDAKRTHLD